MQSLLACSPNERSLEWRSMSLWIVNGCLCVHRAPHKIENETAARISGVVFFNHNCIAFMFISMLMMSVWLPEYYTHFQHSCRWLIVDSVYSHIVNVEHHQWIGLEKWGAFSPFKCTLTNRSQTRNRFSRKIHLTCAYPVDVWSWSRCVDVCLWKRWRKVGSIHIYDTIK